MRYILVDMVPGKGMIPQDRRLNLKVRLVHASFVITFYAMTSGTTSSLPPPPIVLPPTPPSNSPSLPLPLGHPHNPHHKPL